uniref:Uncharacterized protein n=1 Tax=Arundo donax TaxID=35708 RepID=A0A0A9AU54_ARUDO
MRSFPHPVVELTTMPGRLNLAVISGAGGSNIVGVSCDRRTVIYDTAAAAEMPWHAGASLRHARRHRPHSAGDPAVRRRQQRLATSRRCAPQFPGPPAVLPPAQLSSHSRWSSCALPTPGGGSPDPGGLTGAAPARAASRWRRQLALTSHAPPSCESLCAVALAGEAPRYLEKVSIALDVAPPGIPSSSGAGAVIVFLRLDHAL